MVLAQLLGLGLVLAQKYCILYSFSSCEILVCCEFEFGVYFIELTTALECQKQLLMSSISNLQHVNMLFMNFQNFVVKR